jgi:hypothetical protein
MELGVKAGELLFILCEFLKKADSRFSSAPLKISISKAEFIDEIREMGLVAKQERAIYRNLEELEKKRCIVYTKEKALRMGKKGLDQYHKMVADLEHLSAVRKTIESGNFKFKRKIQAKLIS